MTQKNTFVIDKLVRNRIFNSRYWKQQCFGLNAQTLIDKAIQLQYIGSTYSGSRRPTKFICLLFKMLQMNLPKQIAIQFLKTRDYKYLTALGLFFLRLTQDSLQVYRILQPFYNDNRKLRIRDSIGNFSLIYIDDLVDKLLNSQVIIDIILPRIQKRQILEEQEKIEVRKSVLEQQLLQQLN